jgi:hypothetical protein
LPMPAMTTLPWSFSQFFSSFLKSGLLVVNRERR